MADDFELEADISIDVSSAVRDAKRLADALADLNDATGNADDNIEKLERASASAASTLSRFVADSRNATRSSRDQAKAINNLVNQYRQLAQTSGKAVAQSVVSGQNPAQIALKQVQKQMDDERAFSALLTQENNKREAEAAQSATEVARERERIAKQSRARELSALRENIERREQMESQAARAIAQEQQKIAEQGRQRELADLRRAMTERFTLYDEAQAENRRRNIASAIQSTQGLTFGQALNSNAFDGLRESQEYADALNESMRGLANQRYALYDVATSLGVVATATLAAGTAAVVMGGQYDKAFGQVERTTLLAGDQAAALREELVGLTTALPTSFADVTGIATLGAQMNIADEALAGFTETVTQFSSATDVSVDAAATGFGRLAQLTQTPQNEISNLASAIYQTGINAVATESEILSVSEQIATAGNLAGFTNTEIIALASSLSSLGVAPEQARGAVMRIFGDITAAAGEGGAALEQFAQTAGMSADAFAQMWANDPQQAFSAYLDGLSKLDKQLVDVTLKQQGFVNVRDRNVITRLANNMDVYTQALNDTGQAYTENTALAEGVAIAQDNLIDRLTRLGNAFKALVAAGGSMEWLNGLVEGLIAATDAIRQFTETPVGQAVAGITVALTALVGIAAAVYAAFALGKASLLALVVALRSNVASSNGLTLSLRALTAELFKLQAGTGKASAMMVALAAGEGRAAAGAALLGTALRGALITTGIGAALVGVTALINHVGDALKSASAKAEDYFAATGNADFGALGEAIRKDTQAYEENGQALATVQTQVSTTSEHLNALGTSLGAATGAQVQMNDATTGTTTSLNDQTVAIGQNAKAWLAQTIANDKNVQKIWENREAYEALGFSMQDFINATLQDPGNGGHTYIRGLLDDLRETTTFQNTANETFRRQKDLLYELDTVAQAYDVSLSEQINKTNLQTEVMKAAGIEIDTTGDAMEEASGSAGDLGNAMQELVDSTFAGVTSIADVQGALYDLGASLAENGNSFSAYSEAGRNNLEALQSTVSAMAQAAGDDSAAFASNIVGMMASLQGMGVDTGNELAYLGDMLNSLVGTEWGIDFNSAPARQDIASFINESIKALQTRAELERQTIAVQQAARESFNAGVASINSNSMAQQFGIKLNPIDTVVDTSALDSINSAISGLQAMQSTIDTTNHSISGGKGSMSDGFRNAADGAGRAAKGTKDVGKAAKDAQKEVRTLKDYANDLASVFDRQLEFAFGNQNAKDDTANIIQDMKDKIKDAKTAIADMRSNIGDLSDKLRDARQKVRDFNAELKSLRADKNTLDYQLKVAVEYGDTLRAAEIRGELAEKNEEIRSTENDRADASKEVNKIIKEQSAAQKELAQALKDFNTGLKGNSQQARDNRAAVQSLVESYKDQLVQLAANGASQTTLKRKAKELKDEFVRQTSKMGLSREETKKYTKQMGDFKKAIDRVPRNITVTTRASTSAASRAINEFIQKQRQKSVTLKTKVSTPKGVRGGTYRPSRVSTSGRTATGGTYKPSSINSRGPLSASSVRTTRFYAGDTRTTQVKGPGNRTGGLPWSTGGLIPEYRATGGVMGLHPGKPKGTDTAPAWLTPGEWVIQKKAVDHYGSDFFAALNAMRFPQYLAQGSGGGQVLQSSGPAVQLVELLPNQVQQIVRAVSTTIKVDSQTLASSVNGSNKNNSMRGSN